MFSFLVSLLMAIISFHLFLTISSVENYHHFYTHISKKKVDALKRFVEQAEHIYKENMQQYVVQLIQKRFSTLVVLVIYKTNTYVHTYASFLVLFDSHISFLLHSRNSLMEWKNYTI